MAIEQIDITSKEQLITVLQGLGYFDTVEYNSDTSHIYCSIGNDVILKVPAPSSSTGVSTFEFNAGNGRNFTVTSRKMPTLVYKSRNGLLAVYGTSTGVTSYIAFLVGKTNSNAVSVCACSSSNSAKLYKVGAVGETSPEIGDSFSTLENDWSTSPQITAVPIPTHPSNGVSYIKGAKAVICGPKLNTGIATINGVEYATNGYIMISDEA